MKIAIMQPYLFPFIGYYQLIHAADTFVVYDDVNFIKRGWINRNLILSNAGPLWFRAPLLKISQNKKIYETRIVQDPKWSRKLHKTIEQNYSKANIYAETIALVRAVIQKKYETINELGFQSLKSLCDYLEINTQFIRTSRVYYNHHLKGQDRILDICRQNGADTYINASGGQALYSHKAFKQAGIQLYFLNIGQPKVQTSIKNILAESVKHLCTHINEDQINEKFRLQGFGQCRLHRYQW